MLLESITLDFKYTFIWLTIGLQAWLKPTYDCQYEFCYFHIFNNVLFISAISSTFHILLACFFSNGFLCLVTLVVKA